MSSDSRYDLPEKIEVSIAGETTGVALADSAPQSDQLLSTPPASLSQMLIEAGILAADQVQKVQEVAQRERQPLGRILVRDGIILSRDLATLTAVYLGLAMVDLRSETIEPEAIILIPEEVARKHLDLNQIA